MTIDETKEAIKALWPEDSHGIFDGGVFVYAADLKALVNRLEALEDALREADNFHDFLSRDVNSESETTLGATANVGAILTARRIRRVLKEAGNDR